MSTLIFLAGMGTGATIAVVLFLAVISRLTKGTQDDRNRAIGYNERSVGELERRNEIGLRQVEALEKIAGQRRK